MNTTKTYFDHEKLIACQRSIQFVAWSSPLRCGYRTPAAQAREQD